MKHVDYIANPTIEVKNKEICAFFCEYIIPDLKKDNTLFENVKKKLQALTADCYLLEKIEGSDSHKSEWD